MKKIIIGLILIIIYYMIGFNIYNAARKSKFYNENTTLPFFAVYTVIFFILQILLHYLYFTMI